MTAHSSGVSVETVSRTMEALLVQEGRQVMYHDIATGADLAVSPKNTASPSGLLAALVVAGEAVWREATGTGFGLDIVRDCDALLGFRLKGIGNGSLTAVMLATMEATAQVTGSGVVVASDLNALWTAATERIQETARSQPRTAPGATP